MAKFYQLDNHRLGEPDYYFHCPGCGCDHGIWTLEHGGPIWQFNGNIQKPTISPSILVTYQTQTHKDICHSFIKDGFIEYLGDCTHKLANQTIELPEIITKEPWKY